MFSTVLRSLLWVVSGLASIAAVVSASTTPGAPDSAASIAPAPHVVQTTTHADNPRLAPGLVKWHVTFADAQAAATKSGKPVLLFHMMGQLDRQFC
jgi:hypothetical protein